jgi:hypothetical protein
MGKVIGGGLPAAAYGASAELMSRIAPAGDVYQAGTLSGNPLAIAAGCATLNLLDEDAYVHLAATTETLAHGLAEAAAELDTPSMRDIASDFRRIIRNPPRLQQLVELAEFGRAAHAHRPGALRFRDGIDEGQHPEQHQRHEAADRQQHRPDLRANGRRQGEACPQAGCWRPARCLPRSRELACTNAVRG